MKIKLGKYTLHLIIEKEVSKPKTLAEVAVEEMKKMDISQSKLTDELREKVKAIAKNMIIMPDNTVRLVFNKRNDVIEETTVEDFYNKMVEIAEKNNKITEKTYGF